MRVVPDIDSIPGRSDRNKSARDKSILISENVLRPMTPQDANAKAPGDKAGVRLVKHPTHVDVALVDNAEAARGIVARLDDIRLTGYRIVGIRGFILRIGRAEDNRGVGQVFGIHAP